MERLICIAIEYECGLFQTAYILAKKNKIKKKKKKQKKKKKKHTFKDKFNILISANREAEIWVLQMYCVHLAKRPGH